MDEMTQHNAALVEETNAAIEQTETQAVELDRIVDIFHLDADVSASQEKREIKARNNPDRTRAASSKFAPRLVSKNSAALAAEWNDF